MKKQVISFFIIIVMTLGILPAVSFADTATSGSCGASATWAYDADTTTLTISGTGYVSDISSAKDAPWYAYTDLITDVVVENGIETIGKSVFYSLDNLVNVTIADTVIRIYDYAFSHCESLTSIKLPKSIKSIPNDCFYKTGLTSIEIPDGVTFLGSDAFAYCPALESVTIPASVTTIEDRCFEKSENLKRINISDLNAYISISYIESSPFINGSDLYLNGELVTDIVIPATVTSVPKYLFQGCTSIKNLTFSEGVTRIKEYAFKDCINLESVTVPTTLKTYKRDAFANCTNVKKVSIASIDSWLKSSISSGGSPLSGSDLYLNGELITNAEIPEGTTYIDSRAFIGCKSITSITIPDTVTSIGEYAFAGTSIESIDIPSSVTKINQGAFSGTLLKSIDIPDSVKEIETWAFSNCTELTNVRLPSKLFVLSDYIFNGCTSLKKIAIPKSVWRIRQYAFLNSGLTVIYIANAEDINQGAFKGTPLKYVYLGESVSNITVDSQNEPYENAEHIYQATGLPNCEYDDDNDNECNICGGIRCDSHDYIASFNTESHFNICTKCNDITAKKDHSFLNNCDEECDCGYVRGNAHNFEWVIDEENSCISAGKKHRECTDCGLKDSLDTPVDKSYNKYDHPLVLSQFDSLRHALVCKGCNNAIIELFEHSYTDDNDNTCDCGYIRDHIHDFKIEYNKNYHYQKCSICYEVLNSQNHVFDSDCDNYCNVCNAPASVAAQHTYDNDCDSICNLCGHKRIPSPHKYDNTCDQTCNVCGTVRTVQHKYDNKCDGICNVCGGQRVPYHKYYSECDTNCDVCGETRTITHKYGAYSSDKNATTEKDGTKSRVCSVCGNKDTVTDVGSKLSNPTPTPQPKPDPKPDTTPEVEIKDTSKIFKDIKAKGWYKEYVDYSVAYGIFTGTSKTEFSPSMNITRAQFVQVLANLVGVDTSNRNVTTSFKDVPAKKWYTSAVKWASENKVVNGMGDGKFEPNANVTREQMCVMLVNFAKFKDITLKKVENKENFADNAKISKWAKTAVYTCQQADIVNGKGAGKFDPKGTGTRAEASVMFTKFHKDYMK